MGQTKHYFLFSFIVILTILYCCFIYLGMGFYKNFLESQGIQAFSNFTAVTSTSPLLWLILAFVSLSLNSLFAVFSSRKQGDPDPFIFAAALHVTWLLICSFLHGIGCLLPFFMWVPVLK